VEAEFNQNRNCAIWRSRDPAAKTRATFRGLMLANLFIPGFPGWTVADDRRRPF